MTDLFVKQDKRLRDDQDEMELALQSIELSEHRVDALQNKHDTHSFHRALAIEKRLIEACEQVQQRAA